MTDILERLAERHGPGPLNQPGGQDRGEDRALERFLKFNPPKFIGETDPEIAENWLERMINIFATLDYTNDRRVNFTAFQFEGVAQKREDEFIKLKQRTLSVAKYEGKFTKFSKYASKLVINERKRIRRFVQGFNVKIQEGIAAAQISTFTETLEKAQRVESARMQVRDFHNWKRNFSSRTSGQTSKNTQPSKNGRGMGGIRTIGARVSLSKGGRSGSIQAKGVSSSGSAVTPQVTCGYCGKPNHSENDCWRKSRKCLVCGSVEHQLAGCPKAPKLGGNPQRSEKSTSKQTSAGGSRPKVPARVYALDHQQIPDATEVVEGGGVDEESDGSRSPSPARRLAVKLVGVVELSWWRSWKCRVVSDSLPSAHGQNRNEELPVTFPSSRL
ncbi:uncharacterized protein LOC113766437 [Coffea eugenioides]|uniref:uncharacterized protein LOC113766437 n=1 Tax=Coffea eugenioides TaxID=49369 RepID=UPI000F611271|nr:uncharacterized protein LOC113766437 [Coffea eugenioides]